MSYIRSINYQFAAAEALVAGDAEKFVKVLKSFFANIPYNLTDRQNEQLWQAIVYVLLKSVGFGVNAVVALAQIDERHYAEKYDFAGKTVRKLGISFSSEQRTIVDMKQG